MPVAGQCIKKGPEGPERPALLRVTAQPAARAPAPATPFARSLRDAEGGGCASKGQGDADSVRANSWYAYIDLISCLDLL
jgi:hypothetical protein